MSRHADAIENFEAIITTYQRKILAAESQFDSTREKFGLLHALGWADDQAAALSEAGYWIAVQARRSTVASAVEALEIEIESVEKSLLGNHERPSSTSAFANAVSIAKVEGAARFYREAKDMLKHLRKAIEADEAEAAATGDLPDYVAGHPGMAPIDTE